MTIGMTLRKEVIGIMTQMFAGDMKKSIIAMENLRTKLIIGVIVMETTLTTIMIPMPRMRAGIKMLMKIRILR